MTDGNDVEDVELALELTSNLRLLTRPEVNSFLRDHVGEVFRQKHVDADEYGGNIRGLLMETTSAFLVEEVERMGRPTDYQVTDRAEYLLRAQEKMGAYITESEANSILHIGVEVWGLPTNPAGNWKVREVDADLAGPELHSLHNAGFIRRKNDPEGHAHTWQTAERLDDLRDAVGAILNA